MSAWRNSADWRPPQYGWFVPAEFPPFVAWLVPCALGVLLFVFGKALSGETPAWPQRLDQLGLFGGYGVATLLYSPMWGLPAVLAALALRLLLLSNGWFGWASALVTGAIAGLAVPFLLRQGLWLEGPLYGAAFLSIQNVIYSAWYPASFKA